MKKSIVVFLMMFLLSSCNGWFFQPSPYNPPTPFLPPTNTPSIFTPTPVVIGAATATPNVATATSLPTNTPFIFITDTPVVVSTNTVFIPNTGGTPSVNVEVLGCNTSIDVTHGMGEVTNAFITLKNTGNVELTTLKATLFALDEGRVHPDKTVAVTALPVGYEVTLKLTVDSTYKQETPIQVEVNADGGLFQRTGADSCRDIGLFAPQPEVLNTPMPVDP